MLRKLSALAVVCLVLIAICIRKWNFTAEITSFLALPSGDTNSSLDAQTLAQLSQNLAESELARTMILSVAAESPEQAIEAAQTLANQLVRHPEVAWVKTGIDPHFEQDIYNLYFPRRWYFYSDKVSTASLRQRLQLLKQKLSQPTSMWIKKLASRDPLLIFAEQLKTIQTSQVQTLALLNNHFIIYPPIDSREPARAIIFLATQHSPFTSKYQAPLQTFLYQSFAAIQQQTTVELSLEQSSIGRLAIFAEQNIRNDLTRISLLASCGLLVFFIVAFRRLQIMILVMLPLSVGMLAGVAVNLLLFQRIHGLTLAFGAPLLGVCIDYAIHLFNAHCLLANKDCMRHIWPGILIGGLTTIAGFAGLAWTSFPGLREIAVFISVGVVVSILITRFILPGLLPTNLQASFLQRFLANKLSRIFRFLQHQRRYALIPLFIALVISIGGILQGQWNDDIRAFAPLKPDLLHEDERVRALVGRMDTSRFVLALGSTEEEALAINDRIYQRFVQAQREGLKIEFRSAHTFLWSQQLQQENLRKFRQDQFHPRMLQTLQMEGFNAAGFADFFHELNQDLPPPLRIQDFAQTSLKPVMDAFYIKMDNRIGILTFIRDINAEEPVKDLLSTIPGAYYFDQNALLTSAYQRYRVHTSGLLVLGLAFVLLTLIIRYRSLWLAIVALVPALLASTTALAFLAVCGVELHLLHLVAILLVLSIGVDYGVFLVEGRTDQAELPTTFLSIVFSCISTSLSFGLLALSEQPALQAIGATVALGVFFSFVLAPSTFALYSPKRR